MTTIRRVIFGTLVLAVAVITAVVPGTLGAAGNSLPSKLTDQECWRLTEDLSEPNGYFRSDNLLSNEIWFQWVIPLLVQRTEPGGVYMGVGPEQNFTYIAAIKPKMAFIPDIRRQAIMQHLMFKAMFELAKDRADFISILFAKPRPPGIDTSTSIAKIWEAYRTVASDSTLRTRNYVRVVDRLLKTHGFTFTQDESDKLKAVFDAFYYYGPSIATR